MCLLADVTRMVFRSWRPLPNGQAPSEPIDLGSEMNTPAGENCPQVSPDGNFFSFNRYDAEQDVGNMNWVDARVLEELSLARARE